MTMVTPMMMAAMVNNIRQCVAMKEEDVEAVAGVHTGMARLRQQSAPSRRCSCSCRASQGSGPSAPPVVAAGQAGELPEGVSLPLNSFEELRKLEKKLAEDPKLRQNLVATLALVGGRNLGHAVFRVMSCLLSTQLALCCSHYGRNGKQSFKKLALRRVAFEAIRRNAPHAMDCEISQKMASWLTCGWK